MRVSRHVVAKSVTYNVYFPFLGRNVTRFPEIHPVSFCKLNSL